MKDPLQRANHYIAGFEVDVTNEISRERGGLPEGLPPGDQHQPEQAVRGHAEFNDQPDELKKDFIVETGQAYGADFQLKYEKGNASLWAVYWLHLRGPLRRHHRVQPDLGPPAQREPGGQLRLREVRLLAGQRALELRQRLPLHADAGLLRPADLRPGIGTDITTANADLSTIYGPLNQGRLPTYHRMDLGLTKSWKLSEHQLVGTGPERDQRLRPAEHLYYDRVRRAGGPAADTPERGGEL